MNRTADDGARLERLSREVARFPRLPGVYLMKDRSGSVIYVGKAKELRARVRSYLGSGDGRSQIEFLMRRVEQIEKIVTETEEQAFILERDLITKHKPRYNIRLKDDKAYLSIRLDENAAWPRLQLVRRIENDGARYFGPFSFSYELRVLLDIIKRVVPLRTCSDSVFYNRQRPCIEYQIKRCAGPCCLPVDPDEYRRWLQQAIAILEGRTAALEKELEAGMQRAAEELRFEDAAAIRDRVAVLKGFKSGARLMSSRGESRDVFALYREERLAAVSVLQVRLGRVADSLSFSFSEVTIGDQEVLESVLEQFYQGGREIPEEIVLQIDIESGAFIAEMLRRLSGERVEVTVPSRGIKKRLVGLAELNARQHFVSTFDAERRYVEVATALARRFGLKQMPRRIECIDISNLQGSDIVGASVAFVDGLPDKSLYRQYKLSLGGKPDDFAAIFEVVTRRLKRGQEENDLPDLLIIDGGTGQLARALAARDELGVMLDIVSLAKQKTVSDAAATEIVRTAERICMEGRAEPVALEEGTELTRFIQQVRDEAHRFVISFHRKRRGKRVFGSALDGILGVGPERRRRLMKSFGSLEALKAASPEELARNGRMPLSLARKIRRHLGVGD